MPMSWMISTAGPRMSTAWPVERGDGARSRMVIEKLGWAFVS